MILALFQKSAQMRLGRTSFVAYNTFEPTYIALTWAQASHPFTQFWFGSVGLGSIFIRVVQ